MMKATSTEKVMSGWSHHRSDLRVLASMRARPGAPIPAGATALPGGAVCVMRSLHRTCSAVLGD